MTSVCHQGFTVYGLHLVYEVLLHLRQKEHLRHALSSRHSAAYRGRAWRMALVAGFAAVLLWWRVSINAGPPKFIPQENPAAFHSDFMTRART